jgi:hypothetical protein
MSTADKKNQVVYPAQELGTRPVSETESWEEPEVTFPSDLPAGSVEEHVRNDKWMTLDDKKGACTWTSIDRKIDEIHAERISTATNRFYRVDKTSGTVLSSLVSFVFFFTLECFFFLLCLFHFLKKKYIYRNAGVTPCE